MKISTHHLRHLLFLLIMVLLNTSMFSQILEQEQGKLNKPETKAPAETYWNVKAYNATWGLLKVKAIDKDGKIYDIKAIQDSEDTSILNVKALINGQRVSIKLIKIKGDSFYPVKAITQDGTILDVKAIDSDGEVIDVKGISKTGNIVHLRAIRPQVIMYNIIAVSPDGKVNNVKGIKMMDQEVETVIHGVKVFAHVKALKQD